MLEGMGEETRTKCESGSEGRDKVSDTVQDRGGIEKASFGMWPVTDSPSGALGVFFPVGLAIGPDGTQNIHILK